MASALDLWVNGARASETKSAINPGGFSQSGASFTTSDGSYRSLACGPEWNTTRRTVMLES